MDDRLAQVIAAPDPRSLEFLDRVLDLNGAVIYLIVGVLVFAEVAIFIGFVLPGETAAILGGVAASLGRVSLAVMCAIVVVAAIAGDSVGYEVGYRHGQRLLNWGPVKRRHNQLDSARRTLARRGGPAVFVGRFLAFLHAIMPFLAGLSRMHYGKFLLYNAAGGLVWGVGSVLLGFLAGQSYGELERTFGHAAAIGTAAVVVAGAIAWWVIHHRRRSRPPPG